MKKIISSLFALVVLFCLSASFTQAQVKPEIYQELQVWLQDNSDVKGTEDGFYLSRLLSMELKPISLNELTEYTRVRSIQTSEYGVIAYDFFKCSFFWEVNQLVFRKAAGSQRKSGLLSQESDYAINFDGWWYYGGDAEINDAEHHQDGTIVKISNFKILLLIKDGSKYEVLEFAKDNGPTGLTIEDEKGYLYSISRNEYDVDVLAVEPGGKYDGDIVIPDYLEIDGDYAYVTTVRRGAMWKKDGADNIGKITSVTLPPTVSIVGGDAFRGNHSLKSVTYGPGTRIENRAFFDCPALKLQPELPSYAFTDPLVSTRDLTYAIMPLEEPDYDKVDYDWAFFKNKHNGVNYIRWKSMDIPQAMDCICSNVKYVKGGLYMFSNMDLNADLFSGYVNQSGHEMILADNDYVGTHDFPAFSRWVNGEKYIEMPADFVKSMEAKYGTPVRSSYQAAKVTSNGDQFVVTEFELKGKTARYALSWLKGGKEVCTYTETTDIDEEWPDSVWNLEDEGSWGIPHVLTVAYDEKGNVEVFLAHYAVESNTFMHFKQKGNKLEQVQKQARYVWVDSPIEQIQCSKAELLRAWGSGPGPEKYALVDIDKDENEEVILHSDDNDKTVVITIKDGNAVKLAEHYDDEASWFLFTENYVYLYKDNYPNMNSTECWRLEDSKVVEKYLCQEDPEDNRVKHYFKYNLKSGGLDVTDDAKVKKVYELDRKSEYEWLADYYEWLDWDLQYYE